MIFKPSPKIFQNYKSDAPAKTILRIQKSLEKVGIDPRKLKYHGGKIGAGFSIFGGHLDYNKQYISAGKGITYQLSKASAMAEAIERIPTNFSPLMPHIKLNADIKNGSTFKGYTYGEQKNILNSLQIKSLFNHFPSINIEEIKKKDSSRHWIDALSLTENKYKKVPHLLIGEIAGSNGLAAGNTLEEAVSQAFCEVCERHSIIDHVLKKMSAPTVNIETIKDKSVRKAIEIFNSLNISVKIKDLTMGNKLPVMGVLFTNNNLAHEKSTIRKKLFYKTFHAGSHLDLNQAILRCLVEEWQTGGGFNPMTIMFHRELDILDKYFTDKEKQKIINERKSSIISLVISGRIFDDFSYVDKDDREISLNSLASYNTADFMDDIELIKKISKKNSWGTLMIDYSIPEFPLKIVRIIVPEIADDIYRCRYLSPEKMNKFPDQQKDPPLLKDYLKNNGRNLKELIFIAENNLAEGLLSPLPKRPIFAEQSPVAMLNLIKNSYLSLGNSKKCRQIENLINSLLI